MTAELTSEGQQAYRLLDWANGDPARVPDAVSQVDAIALELMGAGTTYAVRALAEVRDVGAVLARLTDRPPAEAALAGTIGGQLDLAFSPAQARDSRGRWMRGDPFGHADPLAAPGRHDSLRGPSQRFRREIGEEGARGNSRPVTSEEFQHLAAIGNQWIDKAKRDSSPITSLDSGWGHVKERAYKETRREWGGATIDAHTADFLPDGADKYAISVKPKGLSTVSVPEHATFTEFSAAMDQAKTQFRKVLERRSFSLGVFHDDENGRVDIDPVAIMSTPDEVETVGAYTHAIGGAYHFKTGDGYWPPHVHTPGAALTGEPPDRWLGPGQWRSYADEMQDGEPDDGQDDDDGIAAQLAAPLTIAGQIELAAIGGHHIPGTDYTYRHNWMPYIGPHVSDAHPQWLIDHQKAAARDGQRHAAQAHRSSTAAIGKSIARHRQKPARPAATAPADRVPSQGAVPPPRARPGTIGDLLSHQDPALASLAAPGMSADAIKAYVDARVSVEVARQTAQITAKQEADVKAALASMHRTQQKAIAAIRKQYAEKTEEDAHSVRTKLVMNTLFNVAGVGVALAGITAGLTPVIAAMAFAIAPLANVIHDYVRSL